MIKINLNKKQNCNFAGCVGVSIRGCAVCNLFKSFACSCVKSCCNKFCRKTLYKFAGLDLQIIHPELKTSLSPVIEFKVDELSLSNKGKSLLAVNNFDTRISFKEVFNKNIIVQKLGADYILRI